MLTRSERLHVFNDVSRVLRRGYTRHSPLVTLKWSPSALPINRVSCIVSNKISKKAVIRNKIKRRLRHAARTILIPYKEPSGKSADIILIAKGAIVNASFQEIIESLKTLWRSQQNMKPNNTAYTLKPATISR